MDRVLAQADFLAGPYSFADIAFYMAYVFADRKGAVRTDATPRLLAWRAFSDDSTESELSRAIEVYRILGRFVNA